MNKKILTLFIIAGILISSSVVGLANTGPEKTPDDSQRTERSEDFKRVKGKNIEKANEHEEDVRKRKDRMDRDQIINIFSEISGMTEEEIEDYISQDGNNLRSLAEEKGLTDAFIKKLKEDQ